ncbi:hypothetical protein HanPSC8_Chr15g0648321 [Helianthus annuus]|nr:hypothetical protein HanPSC8_Chr15g0648321 [Helianthus annuus]
MLSSDIQTHTSTKPETVHKPMSSQCLHTFQGGGCFTFNCLTLSTQRPSPLRASNALLA